VLLDDMDAFELYIHRGLDGRWPSERRLAAVTERLQLTAGDGSGKSS
jgi:hypothetical protein